MEILLFTPFRLLIALHLSGDSSVFSQLPFLLSLLSSHFLASIVSLPDHQVHTVLASNSRLLARFQEINIPPAEFFQVCVVSLSRSSLTLPSLQVDVGVDLKSGASGVLDAYCLYPPDLHRSLQADEPVLPRSYPVIFYVYGEPAAQVARDHWMGKMGLWHRLLAQRGLLLRHHAPSLPHFFPPQELS
jgi:dipeptidyl aminopeptidase/acylaminoacyl peptidase